MADVSNFILDGFLDNIRGKINYFNEEKVKCGMRLVNILCVCTLIQKEKCEDQC